MSQNRSSAVMQQRAEPTDSLDDFPTPPWATRALLAFLKQMNQPLDVQHAWEPACNRGQMARVLGEEFAEVWATDVHDYGYEGMAGRVDFLMPDLEPPVGIDWIITNPPFRLGPQFILRALELAEVGVAVLVRTSFDEGTARYQALFRDRPETWALPFVERVVMWQGVLLDPDVPVWRPSKDDPDDLTKGKMEKPSSATSYQWLIWLKPAVAVDEIAASFKRRIPPCRKALTRPGDYPPVPAHLRAPAGLSPAPLLKEL
ncbi:hypothetical protein SAMN05444149_105407 [Pseudosulfitobacter pseudonitzschiae]|uniref:Methyltransferase n=1 Tax=Pseudosulfitobacter pseudonitzschiae TaxID=1402135 RepID=A0A073IUB4_9RHOB|nr:hypothetical protein [Pseudosulfitobacter pseudonitzschiae]KEJ93928.1 hypothetical protein SUH3_12135 [Pseudosulfitobacter pseudonitzschiae]QKS08550.1 hypothetical protein HT745_08705 [Pseudosulfitobacter pseudonitzschiae]SHF78032.1 hypothetical protein SAMN05444149_105407 [Pseudosulfitobacter pseudonitzschiae]